MKFIGNMVSILINEEPEWLMYNCSLVIRVYNNSDSESQSLAHKKPNQIKDFC